MKNFLWYMLNLQLFSSEGEGAASEQSGDNFADAEHLDTEKFSDEFNRLINGKFKEEFTKKTQAIIDKRFKQTKQLEEYKNKVSPMIDLLLQSNNLSPGEEDKLAQLIAQDNNETEDFHDDEIQTDEKEVYEDKTLSHQDRLKQKIGGWLNESEEFKTENPDFDLRSELRENKLFSQLLLSGVPLKSAYDIVHRDEILSSAMHHTADEVRRQVVQSIEAKGRRPMENGVSSESAIVTSVDVNSLTSQDILKILKQVQNGASIKF